MIAQFKTDRIAEANIMQFVGGLIGNLKNRFCSPSLSDIAWAARIPGVEARAAIERLVEAGRLVPTVRGGVAGWIVTPRFQRPRRSDPVDVLALTPADEKFLAACGIAAK